MNLNTSDLAIFIVIVFFRQIDMILDIASDFLSPGEWEEIWEMCPGDD